MLSNRKNTGNWVSPYFVFWVIFSLMATSIQARQEQTKPISYSQGQLQYEAQEDGDRIPDFSYCGYLASEMAIPTIPVKVVLSSDNEDATEKIQAALDYVGTLPKDEFGFRGAVLLGQGTFKVGGQLQLNASGVVLRGSGQGEQGTILLGTGTTRETLIRVLGEDDRQWGDTLKISDEYVSVNATSFKLESSNKLKEGNQVAVVRPSTQEWIDKLEMNEFGGETGWVGWKLGDHTLRWERKIKAINGNEVELDVPITNSIDEQFGGGYLVTYDWPGRIEKVGVENLTLKSTYDQENPKDEAHRWSAISLENVQDAWVRQIEFKHFAGSAVAIYKTGRRVTVEDCQSLSPVSEIAGERRNSFFTEGQQTLFQRCYSEYGYHDFSTGLAVAGPNAFVQCKAYLPHNFSGAQQGWASGILFDVVRIDGHALKFYNREQEGRGAGWTAANSMFWQCNAAKIENYNPPTAQNWAVGVWAQFSGDGYWGEVNNHVNPRSLFYAQLEERLGILPLEPYLMPVGSEPSTSPTLEQARELTILAREELLTLEEWVALAPERNPISIEHENAKTLADLPINRYGKEIDISQEQIEIVNGRLIWDGKLLTGKTQTVQWWRGSIRPREVGRARPHVTRFVPGRYGKGYTDYIPDVVKSLKNNGAVALDHNYGLWYDRRRDDHERVRRMDPDVWPPFYEQPFARSGKGEAWDRLSKYDLTKYNTWYWSRLKQFADQAEDEGILLMHQNYFQHNILEAGAHWADSPWRPANNINHTGFPEPAPYAGDKRIFLDEQFYDINHPVRRELHRLFIRQCMENFAENSNVLQFTSAEYTGPLHFVEFWLDVIQEWQQEKGQDALIALSTTKDVQDAILADEKRNDLVDVIDIRYWHPSEDGDYAPQGGKHLAPRQHARKMRQGKETPGSVYEGVLRYRKLFPDKAVIYSTHAAGGLGWPVLFAGGSLPSLPEIDVEGFKESLATFRPVDSKGSNWKMENQNGEQLIYSRGNAKLDLELSGSRSRLEAYIINPESGKLEERTSLRGSRSKTLDLPDEGGWVVYIKK
ncbi:DUF6298 domain-containing protein [Echinicola jeungdonensis]